MTLAYARDASESLFDYIYVNLQSKSSTENQALYLQAIAKCKTQKQRKQKAGYYAGKWQRLFDKWVNNQIENTFVLESLRVDFVAENLIL